MASRPRLGAKSKRKFCPGTDRIAVTMRFQYFFHASGSGPQRWVYVVPFISQPSTITVSGAFMTDQPLGQRAEVRVEVTRRALAQQAAHFVVGEAVLVPLQHRHVEDEQPVLPRAPPLRPGLEEAGLPLDVGPQVAGQIGVTDAQIRAAEPGSKMVDAPHAVVVGAQERSHLCEGTGHTHRRRVRLGRRAWTRVGAHRTSNERLGLEFGQSHRNDATGGQKPGGGDPSADRFEATAVGASHRSSRQAPTFELPKHASQT